MSESKCLWCRKTFVRAGAFSNHLRREHATLLDKIVQSEDSPIASSSSTKPFLSLPLYQPPQYPNDDDFEELPLYNESTVNIENTTADTLRSTTDTTYPSADTSETPSDSTIIRRQQYKTENEESWNPLSPFSSALEYKLARCVHPKLVDGAVKPTDALARFFIDIKIPLTRINEFFSSIVPPQTLGVSYGSAYTLRNQLAVMEAAAGNAPWIEGHVNYTITGRQSFFYRDIIECIAYLLKQKAFAAHFFWRSRKEFDYEGKRRFTEMNTCDWWARKEVCIYSRGGHHMSARGYRLLRT